MMTTTNRFLRFLDTLAVADNTKTSSFNPAELRKGKMTVYLILPPEHMRAHHLCFGCGSVRYFGPWFGEDFRNEQRDFRSGRSRSSWPHGRTGRRGG